MIQKKKIKRVTKPCPYCTKKVEPVYKDLESISLGVSIKRRILPRWNTGCCQKHQGRLAVAVKRARILALLPFTDKA